MKTVKRILSFAIVFVVLMTAFCSVSFAAAGTVTWNPDDKGSNTTLSNNNLTATMAGYTNSGVRATKGVSEGKWYWEIKDGSTVSLAVGITSLSTSFTGKPCTSAYIRTYHSYDGTKTNGSGIPYGSSYTTGDIVGVALDMNNGTITFYKKGVSQGVAFSDLKSLGIVYPAMITGASASGATGTANFGATSFSYSVPDGFLPYDDSLIELDAPVLTATAGKAKVDLSWTASEGATSYNVKRSTTAGGPYTTIATVTNSAITYTDSDVTNDTTYYYVVSAVNDSGESENSNEVSATPVSPDITLEVTSVDKAKVGDEITANVVIHNAANICAEDIKLAYDTTRLEFISAEGADGIKIYKEDDLTEGIRRYITASLGKENAANGDKILLELTFKAKAIGEAKVDITKGRIADNATLEMDVTDENCGEKTIIIEGPDDVNRSGEYTLLDLGIDAWYYGYAATDTDTTLYDADQDLNGTIDDTDLSDIVNQILNNSNYPNN